MRVLYFIPRYWPSVGGAQLLARELIRRVALHHDVSVVTQFTSDKDDFVQSVVNARNGEYPDGEFCIRRIGPAGVWRPCLQALGLLYGRVRVIHPLFAVLLDAAITPHLSDLVRQFRPDIIHTTHNGLVYSSETAYKVARRFKIPYVWTSFPHIEGGGWSGPRFRRLYREADALIAMTNREKQWMMEQGALADRIHVIPIGPIVHQEYDAEAFRRVHDLGSCPVVLFLAQKLLYKGYQQLAEAAPLVWDRVPDARFVFIGPRNLESERYFSALADRRIVELPAIVDPFEKSSALAACDIFCMPSVQESLGAVYLEAWSFHKPVIAANIHIAQEVIEEGQDGLLVEQEPQAIAKAICKLLQDRSYRLHMGEAGYQKVKSKYDWELVVQSVEKLYCQLVERGP